MIALLALIAAYTLGDLHTVGMTALGLIVLQLVSILIAGPRP